MKKFLVCSLDDEDYAYPEFCICDTLEKAKEKAMTNVRDWLCCDGEKDMIFEKVPVDNVEYRYDFNDGDSFYINHIIEVDVKIGDYLVIHHRAYDGVDFSVLYIGDKDDCESFMKNNVKETTGASVFGSGSEWDVWSLVEVESVLISNEFLYHATFDCFAKSIEEQGLKRDSGTRNYEDSRNYIYLATDEDVAYSYAECALDVLDENDPRVHSDIVVYAIPINAMDLTLLEPDKNNLSNFEEGGIVSTYQYNGDILPNILQHVSTQ